MFNLSDIKTMNNNLLEIGIQKNTGKLFQNEADHHQSAPV